jgi:hypothetical protein
MDYSNQSHARLIHVPHLDMSFLQPVVQAEHDAENALASTVFWGVAHLPPPKPPSPGPTLLKRLHVREIFGFGMQMYKLNGTTNGNAENIALREPIDFFLGVGIYAAALAVTGVAEFAARQMHAAHPGVLNLPRPDPRHGAFACPDE